MNTNVNIVMYHYVRDISNSRYSNIRGLELKLFVNQIDFLKNKFNIITMEQLRASLIESYELPQNPLLLTFDDGYMDHFTNVLPVLEANGLQGSFFACGKTFVEHKLLDVNKIHFTLASANIKTLRDELFRQLDYYRGEEYPIPSNEELYHQYAVEDRFDNADTIFFKRVLQTGIPEGLRNKISSNLFEKHVGLSEDKFARELYLNKEQLTYMKQRGMYIGIHGYGHDWMENLKKEEIEQDLDKVLECSSAFVDTKAWVMNYPYGSYSDIATKVAKEKGAVLGLTTDVRIADLRKDDVMLLPRLDTNDYPPKSDNYLNLINGSTMYNRKVDK